MAQDPIVDEIRRIRGALAAQHGYDIDASNRGREEAPGPLQA